LLLDADAVARLLGMTRSWVLDHTAGTRRAGRIRGPRIPCLRLGGRTLRYDPDDIAAWLESLKQGNGTQMNADQRRSAGELCT
jgi:predicted DNA-binding transcriptional regulator AlpA